MVILIEDESWSYYLVMVMIWVVCVIMLCVMDRWELGRALTGDKPEWICRTQGSPPMGPDGLGPGGLKLQQF